MQIRNLALQTVTIFAILAPFTNAFGDVIDVWNFVLGPTQPEFGDGNVDIQYNQMIKDAAKAGMGPVDYYEMIGKKSPLPSMVDIDGRLKPVDGHHRVHVGDRISALKGEPVLTYLDVTPERDFTGHKLQDVLDYLFPKDPPDVQLRKYYAIPNTFAGMKKNFYRTATGQAMWNGGMDSKRFADQIEFRVGELLEKSITVTKANESDPAVIAKIQDLIASDPEIVKLLRNSARSKEDQLAVNLQVERNIQTRMAAATGANAEAMSKNSDAASAKLFKTLSGACK